MVDYGVREESSYAREEGLSVHVFLGEMFYWHIFITLILFIINCTTASVTATSGTTIPVPFAKTEVAVMKKPGSGSRPSTRLVSTGALTSTASVLVGMVWIYVEPVDAAIGEI